MHSLCYLYVLLMHLSVYLVAVTVVVQLPSHVWLFVTPWTAALQASLSMTISQSLPKFMSIELVIPSNHLILSTCFLFIEDSNSKMSEMKTRLDTV